ncbi:MAG: MarR family transcriptional regulator [Candidatus Eremiobacteraeota bacterium]|nr:MarR family transcriptional regulator [Candidatus Eremiobacteraeota bacterium]MBC5826720.1 MarR family transcriptional regulator [Candidatus Eremiobacteraeota bacterium]
MLVTNAEAKDPLEQVRRALRLRHALKRHPGVFDAINALLTLKRTAADLQGLIEGGLKQVDLSGGRLNVLMALHSSPNHMMALSDIGEYLVVTRPNITGLVDGLVSDGFVRRVDHPADRRMILAQLTERAVKFMDSFVPQHFRYVDDLMKCLTDAEQKQLVGLLDKIRARARATAAPEYRIVST